MKVSISAVETLKVRWPFSLPFTAREGLAPQELGGWAWQRELLLPNKLQNNTKN